MNNSLLTWGQGSSGVRGRPAAYLEGGKHERDSDGGSPQELEEAALIDGANRYQIFFRIILPLSRAPLATLAVLSFLTNWNDFLWPVYVLFSPQNLTLPPGLSILNESYNVKYNVIMAGGVIASIPVLILYLFTQRYIIEGVSRSGLKG